MKTLLFILGLFLVTTVIVEQAGAQKVSEEMGVVPDDQFSLKVENIKTHKRLFLSVGQTVGYKLRASKHFAKGQITAITDSTISFARKKAGEHSLAQKDISALRIPKTTRKKVKGYVLMVGGAWILVGVLVNPAQGQLLALNIMAYAVGLVSIFKGYSIKKDEKIYIDESWSWRLKPKELIDSVTPGSVINVTLKSGEIIEELKVGEIDLEKIKGVQISQNAREQFVYTDRTIMITDMKLIKLR